jgi:hypothetical protein
MVLDFRSNAETAEFMVDAMAGPGDAISGDFPLKTTEKKGTRIVSAKGAVHYLVQTAAERREIADAETKAGQTFDIAGTTVKLDRLEVRPDHSSVNFNMSLIHSTPPTPAPANVDAAVNGPPAGQPRVIVTVTDATGREICAGTIQGSMRMSNDTPITPPLKLRLSVPTKTKDLVIPFELKDLPLP